MTTEDIILRSGEGGSIKNSKKNLFGNCNKLCKIWTEKLTVANIKINNSNIPPTTNTEMNK